MKAVRTAVGSRKYKQVELTPLRDAVDGGAEEEAEASPTQQWLEYTWRKLLALLWILCALALGMWLQLPEVILNGYTPGKPSRQLNRFAFNIALACFGGWCCIASYLIIWLKYVKKIESEWEEHSPRAIPLATISAVLSLFAFCGAFWPLYGLLSIPIVFLLFLGALNTAHFVPI